MYYRNNNSDKDHIVKNQFTAYLVTAIRRRKQKYLSEKSNHQHEIPLDYLVETEKEFDLLSSIPIIEQLENEKLIKTLITCSDRRLYILIERAISGRSFVDIAKSLGISCRNATMIYYRTLKKLRKELDDYDR